MKYRIGKKAALITAANAISFCCFIGICLSAASEAQAQSWNYAAGRWSADEDYTQISCFLSEEAGFTVDSVGTVRNSILNALKIVSVVPDSGQKLCPDAYSAPVGQATVKSEINGRSEAEITAVGGDFFLIHNFRLLDGAYFTEDDAMQDGAVIDRSLAWALYGSDDVAGMNITINNVKFYIAGVIDDLSTEEEKKCSGELPRAYISYAGASGFISQEKGEADGAEMQTAFTAVSCYEIIMPDPVENYSFKAVQEYMAMYGKNAEVIQNTERFAPMKRLKALKNISYNTVKDSTVVYPYWENASRIVESEISFSYRNAAFCLIIPLITLILLIVKAYRKIRLLRLGEKLKAMPEKANTVIKKLKKRKENRNEQKNQ